MIFSVYGGSSWIELRTFFNKRKVKIAINGADNEKTNRCCRIRFRSIPSDIKNETNPNAAGA